MPRTATGFYGGQYLVWNLGGHVVIRVTNITKSLESLKTKGFWIYGLDERGTQDYDRIDFAEKSAIVLGGEGHGLHDLVAKHCDILARIRMAGSIASLNVSVAAGVVLFEWRKRSVALQK